MQALVRRKASVEASLIAVEASWIAEVEAMVTEGTASGVDGTVTAVEATLTDGIEVAGCVTVIMAVEATTEKEAVVPIAGTTIVVDTIGR